MATKKTTPSTKTAPTKTKKQTTTAKSKVNPMAEIFNICPYSTVSNFEKTNFLNRAGLAYPRHIINSINRVREIDCIFKTVNSFEQKCLSEEKASIMSYLENEGVSSLKSAIENFEEVEGEYWASFLGKKAAIEILANGKVSVETLEKMAKLPEDLYTTATLICVKLSNAIDLATRTAESTVIQAPDNENIELQTTAAPATAGPRALKLKKIKK